jgi:hypothetical protein
MTAAGHSTSTTFPLCTLMRQLPVRVRKHDFATKPNNSIEQPSRNTRPCRPRIRRSCHAPSPIFVCPSIDGVERDVDSLAGIEPLELLLMIPHSIAAAPTKAWVRRDASGLLEPPCKAQLSTSLCLQVGGVRRPNARHATSEGS